MTNVDEQYIEILDSILDYGVNKETRSGKVISTFGQTARFNLNEGLPILTIKKVFLRGIIRELLWFISGDTNMRTLLVNGVNIWNDDAERYFHELLDKHNEADRRYNKSRNQYQKPSTEEFLDSVRERKELTFRFEKYYTECDNNDVRKYVFGDLGPVYGKNWRRFGVNFVDQVKILINKLKNTPNDRRLLITGYNPDDVDTAALPPCHLLYQFYTKPMTAFERALWYKCRTGKENASEDELNANGVPSLKLSCMLYCRSQDFLLGTVFNWASAALLTHMIAEVCNMGVDELIWFAGDVHVYENQLSTVDELESREGFDTLPKLKFKRKVNDIDDFKYEDFIIEDYQSDPIIKIPLSTGKKD